MKTWGFDKEAEMWISSVNSGILQEYGTLNMYVPVFLYMQPIEFKA